MGEVNGWEEVIGDSAKVMGVPWENSRSWEHADPYLNVPGPGRELGSMAIGSMGYFKYL